MKRNSYLFDIRRVLSPVTPRRNGRSGKLAAVTGGAGFLGSHLGKELTESGCDVVCIDSFPTGSAAKVAHLAQSRQLSMRQHGVTTIIRASRPIFDEICDFAGPTSPIHYQADRVSTALTCALPARV